MLFVVAVIPLVHVHLVNFSGWGTRHSGHVCGEIASRWIWRRKNRSQDFCNACAAEPQGWCSWVAPIGTSWGMKSGRAQRFLHSAFKNLGDMFFLHFFLKIMLSESVG
jgi:hypothetical protein